jgi:hypothetical protein
MFSDLVVRILLVLIWVFFLAHIMQLHGVLF